MTDLTVPVPFPGTSPRHETLRDRNGGGPGIAGGTEVHATAMVLAAVSMMSGTRLQWLEGVANDVPVVVTAETGGPGDDVGLVLIGGEKVEVQSKKGLKRGPDLWEALDALVVGVATDTIQYGVLAVTPDSSGTICNDLANDVIRIGQGAGDPLTDIGMAWRDRLDETGLDAGWCARIRIQTIDVLQSQGSDRRLAINALRTICADPAQAEAAYSFLYRDAITAMRLRGRWTTATLIGLLRSYGIDLREGATPSGVLTKLSRWTRDAQARFSLPAARNTIAIQHMLPARLMTASREEPGEPDASAALERYHGPRTVGTGGRLFSGEWTGRFNRLNVVMSGPGLGKTTLAARIAWEYAMDGIPALVVPLKRLAAALSAGTAFETALELHGLSGSGLDGAQLRGARAQRLVVIADALDEAGRLHDEIAKGLVAYAAGHPEATIIVTTRPIGYETGRLADWRHYVLDIPDEKLGPLNLGRLIAASLDMPLDDPGCRRSADRQLRRTAARDAIVRSPLLLGMSATLIVRDERLPATRPAFYEAMVELFEERDAETSDGPLSVDEAKRILDIVGWHLTADPLLTWDELRNLGIRQLADDLDQRPLAVAALFERGFGHWERAGIVEKVHHAGTRLVTFVHKTFGEFAAARFLTAMTDGRAAEMERIVDVPALGEVVGFAGAMGLGNALARMFVDRRATGASGQFERALALARDRDAQVDDDRVRELAIIALDIAGSQAGDRFAIGRGLVELAARRPAIVGPVSYARLDDPSDDVQLVAWAAAVSAGPDHYDPAGLEERLAAFTAIAVGRVPEKRSGVLRNPVGDHVELVREIALATLRARPEDKRKAFADAVLADRPFTTWDFTNSVQAILGSGRAETSSLLLGHRRPETASFARSDDEAWNRATNRIMRSIAAAVADDDADGGFGPSATGRWPQFSALVRLTGLWESEAPDVRNWTKVFDQDAVAEAIRGLVAASDIDAARLSVEAREVRDRLQAEPLNDLHDEFGHPDLSEPAWQTVAALPLDRARIEGAFHHGSAWMLSIAANLLSVLPATPAECEHLLAESEGVELCYASHVVANRLPGREWRDLVLARLDAGIPDGGHHLLAALGAADVELPPETRDVIERALRSDDPRVVEDGARLAVRWIAAGGVVDITLAVEALGKKLRREGSFAGSEVRTRYRAELLRLLVAAQALDEDLLGRLREDPDAAVRSVAEEESVRRGDAAIR